MCAYTCCPQWQKIKLSITAFFVNVTKFAEKCKFGHIC